MPAFNFEMMLGKISLSFWIPLQHYELNKIHIDGKCSAYYTLSLSNQKQGIFIYHFSPISRLIALLLNLIFDSTLYHAAINQGQKKTVEFKFRRFCFSMWSVQWNREKKNQIQSERTRDEVNGRASIENQNNDYLWTQSIKGMLRFSRICSNMKIAFEIW